MPVTVTTKYKQAAAWLSYVAYLGSDNHPEKQRSLMADALQGAIPPSANGPYKLVWGPAPKNGFLTYIAKSTVDGSYAVGCRGTLSDTAPLQAFINDVIADTTFFYAERWLYPKVSGQGTAGYYTWGMQDAFDNVKSATDPTTGLTMQRFLRGQGNNIEVMVAGHSLGGALSNLVAVYLADELAANVSSFTFAAPTITNDTWGKDIFNKYIKTSYQCVNSNDIVPMAYWIDTMPEIGLTYIGAWIGYYLDGTVATAVEAAALYLAYAQSGSDGDRYKYTPVAGRDSFQTNLNIKVGDTWADVAGMQHSLVKTYFPAVGLKTPTMDGDSEGNGTPKAAPLVGSEGIIFKNPQGKKLRIVQVEE